MANVKQAKLDFIKGYGENYRKLRKSKGLTLEELGKIIHYSDKTINNIETEQRTPTIEQLKAYHNYFGTSYEYLLGETTVNDICLQDICEYTGLSEDAVKVLHDLKNDSDEKDLISVIDYMLSDYEQLGIRGKFYSLLGLIWEYLFAEYIIPKNSNASYIEYRIKGHSDITRAPIERLKDMVLPEITQKLMNTKDKFFEERNKPSSP